MEDRDNPLKAAHYLCGGEETATPLIVQALLDEFSKNPRKTAKGIAEQTHRVLQDMAEKCGYGVESVILHTPEQSKRSRGRECYTVMWEGGPYEWAMPCSMALTNVVGGVVEPYYSFDLTFYPSEWK